MMEVDCQRKITIKVIKDGCRPHGRKQAIKAEKDTLCRRDGNLQPEQPKGGCLCGACGGGGGQEQWCVLWLGVIGSCNHVDSLNCVWVIETNAADVVLIMAS